MVSYRYTAEDPQGRRVDGQIDAVTVDEARRRLAEDGFRVLEVAATGPVSDAAAREGHLSPDEAQELVENVAQLSAAGLPLAPGLRAAADECDSSQLARALVDLADQLDQGRPLEDVLESCGDSLPAYVTSLMRAVTPTAELGLALTELVEHYRDVNALRQDIWRGLTYPLVVASLAAAVLLFIVVFVAGGIEKIFVDFGLQLPLITEVFLWWRRVGLWLLPAFLLTLVLVATLVRWRLGAAAWQRWLASTPVVGPLWHWLGLLEWIGLLRVLVQREVTLLEALRLSAGGVSNINISRLSLSLAEGIARGRTLTHMITSQRQIPSSLVPLVRWGEQAGGLVEALEMGREMLEQRVRTRSLWLQTALPPVLFVAIACGVLLVVGALFVPLIDLVGNLT